MPSKIFGRLYNAAKHIAADERTGQVLSSYGRRLLEGTYDKLVFETPVGQKLVRLSKGNKAAAEAALYILGALGTTALPENNPLQKLFKDLAQDAPSEIAGRFINGPESFNLFLKLLTDHLDQLEFQEALATYMESQNPEDKRKATTAIQEQLLDALNVQPSRETESPLETKPARESTLDRINKSLRDKRAALQARRKR